MLHAGRPSACFDYKPSARAGCRWILRISPETAHYGRFRFIFWNQNGPVFTFEDVLQYELCRILFRPLSSQPVGGTYSI